MNSIAAIIDRQPQMDDALETGLHNLGMVTWGRRNRFIGFVLGQELLALDFKLFTTFRVRIANLGSLHCRVFYHAPRNFPYEYRYIDEYFRENEDNPFAMSHFLQTLYTNNCPDQLTQFPPLNYEQGDDRHNAIVQLQSIARPADVVFTYDRTSGLSRLIRRADRGMWSHTAMVSEKKSLYEVTTAGLEESDFLRLSQAGLAVGLYRPIAEVSEDQISKLDEYFLQKLGKTRYNWNAVVRIYLQKVWKIPYRRKPNQVTPAELLNSNQFSLVSYA